MWNYLNRPCPLIFDNRIKWTFSIGISVFVFLFLWIFRPFELFEAYRFPVVWIAFGYGLITFLLNTSYFFLWHLADNPEKPNTMGKELLLIFLLITLIGLANHLYYPFTLSETADVTHQRGLLEQLGITYAVAFFPVAFTLVYSELHYRAYFEGKRQEISGDRVEHAAVSVEITGDTAEARTQLSSNHFRFAKAAGNYIEIHSIEEGALKRQIHRLTMQRLEEQLSAAEFPYVKTHRSYLVNPDMVTNITGNANGYTLTINGSEIEIPVSRNRIDTFNAVMNG